MENIQFLVKNTRALASFVHICGCSVSVLFYDTALMNSMEENMFLLRACVLRISYVFCQRILMSFML